MENGIVGIVEEKMCYEFLLNQISDYLNDRVSCDDSPTLATCSMWNGCMENTAMGIRNAIAVLVENASEETMLRVREEME